MAEKYEHLEKLRKECDANPKQTIGNAVMVLKEDPLLAGAIKMNELTERVDIVKDLGWTRNGYPV